MASTDLVNKPVQVTDDQPDVTIALDPHRRGPAFARLVEYGRPVWALIADLQGNDWNVAQTARNYAVPEAAVQAALDYYRAEPKYIDAWLLLNRSAFE